MQPVLPDTLCVRWAGCFLMLNGVFNSTVKRLCPREGWQHRPGCTSDKLWYKWQTVLLTRTCLGAGGTGSCSQVHGAEMSSCAVLTLGLGKLQDALKYRGRRGELPTSCVLFCSSTLLCSFVLLSDFPLGSKHLRGDSVFLKGGIHLLRLLGSISSYWEKDY